LTNSIWKKEEKLSSWGQSGSEAGCPKRLRNLQPGRFSSPNWRKPWATGWTL